MDRSPPTRGPVVQKPMPIDSSDVTSRAATMLRFRDAAAGIYKCFRSRFRLLVGLMCALLTPSTAPPHPASPAKRSKLLQRLRRRRPEPRLSQKDLDAIWRMIARENEVLDTLQEVLRKVASARARTQGPSE